MNVIINSDIKNKNTIDDLNFEKIEEGVFEITIDRAKKDGTIEKLVFRTNQAGVNYFLEIVSENRIYREKFRQILKQWETLAKPGT